MSVEGATCEIAPSVAGGRAAPAQSPANVSAAVSDSASELRESAPSSTLEPASSGHSRAASNLSIQTSDAVGSSRSAPASRTSPSSSSSSSSSSTASAPSSVKKQPRVPSWKRERSPSLRLTPKRARVNVAKRFSVQEATSALLRSSRIVIFTGAGISVSAGLSTFSTKGGLYAQAKKKFQLRRGIDAFSFKFLQSHRSGCQEFLMNMLEEVQQASPTLTHEGIAKLLHVNKLARHYTLNVDRLHEMAGMSTWAEDGLSDGSTVMMHGNIWEAVCSEEGHIYEIDQVLQRRLHRGRLVKCNRKGCQSTLRPRVMMYGEEEDEVICDDYDELLEADLMSADLIVWVGLSFEQAATVEYFRSVYRHLTEHANAQRREARAASVSGAGHALHLVAQPMQIIVNPRDVSENVFRSVSGAEKLRLANVICKSDELFGAVVQALEMLEGTRPLPLPRSPTDSIGAATREGAEGECSPAAKLRTRAELIDLVSEAAAAAMAGPKPEPIPADNVEPTKKKVRETLKWACCGSCDKWRIVERKYGAEEKFGCGDVGKTCNDTEDEDESDEDSEDEEAAATDAKPVAGKTGKNASSGSQDTLKWACCGSCDKWRIVEREYGPKELFGCQDVSKTCNDTEDEDPSDSDDESQPGSEKEEHDDGAAQNVAQADTVP